MCRNLTLHADFVLSCARVRDEIHLHRHLPHRSVGRLTWKSTKTTTRELESGLKLNQREKSSGGKGAREQNREIRPVENGEERLGSGEGMKRTTAKTVGAALLSNAPLVPRPPVIQELIRQGVNIKQRSASQRGGYTRKTAGGRTCFHTVETWRGVQRGFPLLETEQERRRETPLL